FMIWVLDSLRPTAISPAHSPVISAAADPGSANSPYHICMRVDFHGTSRRAAEADGDRIRVGPRGWPTGHGARRCRAPVRRTVLRPRRPRRPGGPHGRATL